MHLRNATLLALAGLLCGAAPGHGQSLADVARREAERKRAVKEGGKVYTNRDLPQVPAPATPALQPETKDSRSRPDSSSIDQGRTAARKAETQQSQGTGQKGEPAREKDQTYWSQRMKDLRNRLDRDQTYVEALQSRVNALATDFVNRDDPAQRAQVAIDRQRALSELERLKTQIGDSKQAIADLEEEARRASVPPGWLR